MSQPVGPEADGSGQGISNLIHLFGDRFAPLAKGKGPRVYSRTDTTVAVDRQQLATTLIAASVWGLRESGLVRLEQRQEKKLGLIKLKRTHMWPAGDGPVGGDLERRVLNLIRGNAGESGLTSLPLRCTRPIRSQVRSVVTCGSFHPHMYLSGSMKFSTIAAPSTGSSNRGLPNRLRLKGNSVDR